MSAEITHMTTPSVEADDEGNEWAFAAMCTTELSPHVAPIAAALIARSNDKYDAEFVCNLVARVAAEFDGAPVQDFVPVLVAKEATDELRRLDALQPLDP